MFDWTRFLDDVGVPHVIGPAQNVRRDHVGLACPRCPNDIANHFSIDLRSGQVRGCWRNSSHWMPPHELIATLAGVTLKRAKEILQSEETISNATPTTLLGMLQDMDKPKGKKKLEQLEMPDEFRRFTFNPGRRESYYHAYLEDRGFDDPIAVAHEYDLRWCDTGEFKSRIIFPLRKNQKLFGWTGRAITKAARKRYHSHPPGDSMQNLLWEGRVHDCRTLIIAEGPFDALKLDWAADDLPIGAVALLTNKAGPAKLSWIVRLAEGRSVWILLDHGAESEALSLQSSLRMIGARVSFLPSGIKDPGDLSLGKARKILKDLDLQRIA